MRTPIVFYFFIFLYVNLLCAYYHFFFPYENAILWTLNLGYRSLFPHHDKTGEVLTSYNAAGARNSQHNNSTHHLTDFYLSISRSLCNVRTYRAQIGNHELSQVKAISRGGATDRSKIPARVLQKLLPSLKT